MDVGAVGGMAMGGAGAMGGAAAMGTTGAAPAAGTAPAGVAAPASTQQPDAANSINMRYLDGAFPMGLQHLAETMKDFSSAEILMALMILAAMEKDDDKKTHGASGAALGLLAGLALANQFNRSAEIAMNGPMQMPQGGGGVGMNLNVSG
jgi:hypothetical protein